MGAIVSQITSRTIVYSTIYLGADQKKYQRSVSLAFVTGEFPAQRSNNAENVSIWWRHKWFHPNGNVGCNNSSLPQHEW